MSKLKQSQEKQQNSRSGEIAYLVGLQHKSKHPPSIGNEGTNSKFTPDGHVNYFPGNTFICHLNPSSDAFAAVKRLQSALKTSPFGEYFTFLPQSSFHMTIFPALCGAPLGAEGWANGIDKGLSLDEINQIFLDRLQTKTSFASVKVVPKCFHKGFSIGLTAETTNDAAKLLDARRMLQNLTGIRRPDFDEYQFHISIAYLKRWMSKAVAEEHLKYSDQLFAEFRESAPHISFGPIEFCAFQNMHEFKTLNFLNRQKKIF